MKYYIIEHPSRGALVDYDYGECKPRFSWSILRTDPKIMPFYSSQTVEQMLRNFKQSLRDKCSVLTIENGRVKVK